MVIILAWLTASVAFWAMTRRGFRERFVTGTTPGSLGFIRVLNSAILLFLTLSEDLAASALLPREMIVPYGIMDVLHALPGFERFQSSLVALQVFQWITAITLVCGMLGVWTRLTVPVSAALFLVMGGLMRQYGICFHTGLVPLYVQIVLSFTPCGDGLSIDRFNRRRRGFVLNSDATVYGWSRYACWVAIATPYFAAGLSKIRSADLSWCSATNIQSILFRCSLEPLNSNWTISLKLVGAPDILFSSLGIIVVITELAFCTVLFSSTARLICPTVMMLSQVGIIFLQNIFFVDLILLLVFLDGTRFGYTIRSGLSRLRTCGDFNVNLPAFHQRGRAQNFSTTEFWRAAAVACLLCILLLAWILRIEYYPLTAMQMFAQVNTSGIIEYNKVIAHRESGATDRLSLTDVIGNQADFRYRPVLQAGLLTRDASAPAKYFSHCGTLLNRLATPGRRVIQLELQRWRWDFRNHPNSQTHGELVDSRVFEMNGAIPERMSEFPNEH
jgi:hypothetical protein